MMHILILCYGLSMITYGGGNTVVYVCQTSTHTSSSFSDTTWIFCLNNIYRIHFITFHLRQENPDRYNFPSFRGPSVYVSNTTDRLDGILCYKDNNFPFGFMDVDISMPCRGHGKYIMLNSEELQSVTCKHPCIIPTCYVSVHGCPTAGNYSGSECCPSEECKHCNLDTGTCLGCQPGYRGLRCEQECDKGTYGDGCNEACGHCRDLNQCSNIDGTYLTGCSAGYHGYLYCDKGMYGHECNETCGHCDDVDRCSPINGKCLTGCDAGYLGEFCTTKCDKGMYGDGCNETCGHCRDVNKCSNINGTCLTGCSVGYQGELCNEGSRSCFEEMGKCYLTIDLERWENELHDGLI